MFEDDRKSLLVSDHQPRPAPKAVAAVSDALDGKPLSFLMLVSVCYFLICGGSYGTEDLGGAIPPLFALLGLLIVPWFWSFPIAMMTAELATAMPDDDSGYLGWIRQGLGSRWSFVDAWITIVVVMFDQALYPLIFVSYLDALWPMGDFTQWLVCVLFVLLCLLINIVGAGSVGGSSQAFSVLALLPFVMFFVIGLFAPEYDGTNFFGTEMRNVSTGEENGDEFFENDNEDKSLITDWDFGLYWSVLVWATCGYEYSGFLVTQTQNPTKTFPRVLTLCVLLMILTYVLPITTLLAVSPDDYHIEEGSYPVVAAEYLGVGQWLGYVLAAGGLFSTMGTFNAYLHTASTALASQADVGVVPGFMSYRLPQAEIQSPTHVTLFGTPFAAMLFYSVTTCILVRFEFSFVVMVEAALYCFHVCLNCVNFVYMRYSSKRACRDLVRPFKVKFFPGQQENWPGVVVAAFPFVVALIELVAVGWNVLIVALVAVLVAFVAAILAERFQSRRRFGFAPRAEENEEAF